MVGENTSANAIEVIESLKCSLLILRIRDVSY